MIKKSAHPSSYVCDEYSKKLPFSFQSRADGYFTFREVDRRHVAVILSKSLQDLTDQSKPTADIRWVNQP
jgi:hypothetical protein